MLDEQVQRIGSEIGGHGYRVLVLRELDGDVAPGTAECVDELGHRTSKDEDDTHGGPPGPGGVLYAVTRRGPTATSTYAALAPPIGIPYRACMTKRDFVRALRRLGLNQSQAATYLRTTQSSVSDWTRGVHRVPGPAAAAVTAWLRHGLPDSDPVSGDAATEHST